MNICFVSEHYPPTEGGVATSTQRVATHLVKAGATVHVFTFDHERPMEVEDYHLTCEENGVVIHRFGPFFIKQKKSDREQESTSERTKAILRRRVFNQMLQCAEALSVDVVLSFYLLNAGHLAQLLANALEVPCVAGVRGNDIGRNLFNVERFGVIRWVAESADAVACVNTHLKKRMLMAFPGIRDKTCVIENSIAQSSVCEADENVREQLRQRFGWGREDLITVFAGNFREKKGVVAYMHALAACRRSGRGIVRLLQIGPDISEKEMACMPEDWAYVREHSLVAATGHLPRQEVMPLMAGCDVVLMPSLEDGLSNGLLEGMAVGLCPVVSDLFEGVVTHHASGIVCRAGDSEALSEGLLSLYADRSRMRKMGHAARERLRTHYVPEREASEYLALFEKAMAKRGTGR